MFEYSVDKINSLLVVWILEHLQDANYWNKIQQKILQLSFFISQAKIFEDIVY